MDGGHSRHRQTWRARPVVAVLVALLAAGLVAAAADAAPGAKGKFSDAKAFDVSKPLAELARAASGKANGKVAAGPTRSDRAVAVSGSQAALWAPLARLTASPASVQATAAIPAPSVTFEGISNQDNFNIFGGRVNPPDPVGDVGPNHYVEMVNLAFAVYSKTGTVLLPPTDTGTLWAGFPIEDCTDPSGDPIVVYDQFADRWILSQFTTRGLDDPSLPFYNCVAISTTGDPTGSYYRYAFTTGLNFPDYPKYGVWRDSYIITTREFGPTVEYGIGVYAIDRNKMIEGDPNARFVGFFLDGNDPDILPLVGDGLLPPDIDGKTKPKNAAKAPIVGTQDAGFPYGATVDAINIWELDVKWNASAEEDATLVFKSQLPTAPFAVYPCVGGLGSRDCLPQPGIVDPAQFLDTLSSRQRPTWRLAYRNFGSYEALVTNQTVGVPGPQAAPRWYEIRRTGETYAIHQQGTYAPADGIHRWMGSIAQDKKGNMALGYSVVNGTSVFPGIRYTGRLAGDPLGTMPLGEGTIINGSGVQTTTNSRWGDYTSMNIDPVDDCTFWYVNEYYTAAGQASSPAGWQTRIGAFKLPGC